MGFMAEWWIQCVFQGGNVCVLDVRRVVNGNNLKRQIYWVNSKQYI